MPGLVTVESYTSPWDAHVACGLLESEGIPASIAGEHHVWANWPISQALGGVRIQVPPEHVAKAHDVLAAMRRGDFEAALESELQLKPAICPKCGSSKLQIVRSRNSIFLSIVTLFLIAAPFPRKIAGLRCTKCGTMVPDGL
ncbi:MAG: putative signal transducing protein [Thiobacillaceae bacterium]